MDTNLKVKEKTLFLKPLSKYVLLVKELLF